MSQTKLSRKSRELSPVHPAAAAIDIGATMHVAAVGSDRDNVAGTVGRTDTALGAFYRRLSARLGKVKAITATARKIAVLFYNTLRHGKSYVDPGATYYEDRYQQRVLSNLQRRARSLGFILHKVEPDTAQVGVS
jgi:hypothetical protein